MAGRCRRARRGRRDRGVPGRRDATKGGAVDVRKGSGLDTDDPGRRGSARDRRLRPLERANRGRGGAGTELGSCPRTPQGNGEEHMGTRWMVNSRVRRDPDGWWAGGVRRRPGSVLLRHAARQTRARTAAPLPDLRVLPAHFFSGPPCNRALVFAELATLAPGDLPPKPHTY